MIQTGNIAKSGHNSIWGRVYDTEGIAPGVKAEGGGVGAKTGLIQEVRPCLTPDRAEKRQNGPRFRDEGEDMFSLTGQDVHGVEIAPTIRSEHHNTADVHYLPGIRRLTPLETERLQGFPDNWTARGIDDNGNEVEISDTQRYKMCGNAVTTNVIAHFGRELRRLR